MRREGLTLVETLAAVAILVALAVAAVPSWQALVRAQENAAVEDEAWEQLLALDPAEVRRLGAGGSRPLVVKGRDDLRLVVEEFPAVLAPVAPPADLIEHLAPNAFLLEPTPRRYLRLSVLAGSVTTPVVSLIRPVLDHPSPPSEEGRP